MQRLVVRTKYLAGGLVGEGEEVKDRDRPGPPGHRENKGGRSSEEA